jgi:hypothetical protein
MRRAVQAHIRHALEPTLTLLIQIGIVQKGAAVDEIAAEVADGTLDFALGLRLSVSNSLSGGDWELDEVPAVGDPMHMVQIGRGHRVSAGDGQWRVTVQRRVRTYRVVVRLELAKLPFQVAGIPEQHMIEKFAPHRPDQALDERV